MGGIEFNGVNGANGVFGSKKTGETPKTEKTFDFGFNSGDMGEVGLDTVKFSATKPAFKQDDLDKMWAMAGIEMPGTNTATNSIKTSVKTANFANEGNYTDDDINLANTLFYLVDAGHLG